MALADQAQTDALLNYYQNPDIKDRSGSSLNITPTSGTAFQPSLNRNSTVYVNITTAAALAVAIGPDNTTAIAIMASESAALGVITLDVPMGWWVKLTGTMADVVVTKVKK